MKKDQRSVSKTHNNLLLTSPTKNQEIPIYCGYFNIFIGSSPIQIYAHYRARASRIQESQALCSVNKNGNDWRCFLTYFIYIFRVMFPTSWHRKHRTLVRSFYTKMACITAYRYSQSLAKYISVSVTGFIFHGWLLGKSGLLATTGYSDYSS